MRLFPRIFQFRSSFAILSVLSFICCICIGALPFTHMSVSAQQIESQTLSAESVESIFQTGMTAYQSGEYSSAIAQWQQALSAIKPDNLTGQSVLLENLAHAHHQVGDFSEEINYWEETIKRHQQLGELQAIGRARIEQAQAYSRLGQHRRAIALLCGQNSTACTSNSALHITRALTDVNGEAAALASLGGSYRLTGNYEESLSLLNKSLAIIETNLNNPTYQATVLNSLGNTHSALAQESLRRAEATAQQGDDTTLLMAQAEEDTQQAISLFQRSADLAQNSQDVEAQVRSHLSLIPLFYQTNQTTAAVQAWQTTYQLIERLPNSQSKAFDLITLAGYLDEPIPTHQCPIPNMARQQTQMLEAAIDISRTIQSPRTESFALGQLGSLYERCGDYEKALSLTQSARIAADQEGAARDSLYLWAWQRGRILLAQQKPDAAAAAYRQALDTLESIRSDLLAANRDLQFDFRDRVEPIYREFSQLKLADVPSSVVVSSEAQPNIDTVLVTLDRLKLAELQNYFANDCIISPIATRVDLVEEKSNTAVISTVFLEGQAAVIANFPNKQRQIELVEIDQSDLAAKVIDYRRLLETYWEENLVPPTDLYNLLVRPFEESLEALEIGTLVFIHDGILRSIPMAALYDGQQYLIEKYAIATTPSLTLTDSSRTARDHLSALILGLSEASNARGNAYSALEQVAVEVTNVQQLIPDSQVFTNQDFSEANIKQSLSKKDYKVLHIATHGNFGASPDENFIVTGQKLDNQTNKVLTISELDALIRSISGVDRAPIDLLTLSACDTSVGDNRATLGLAGVAVRAGVKSAIASLWSVNDQATAELITHLYTYLSDPALSKAQALQAAQKDFIAADATQHPYYWSAFTLIGNWL